MLIEIAEERSLKIKSQTTNDCDWGEWGQCSKRCGNGFRKRVLTKKDGKPYEESFVGLSKEREISKIREINCEPISGTQSNPQKFFNTAIFILTSLQLNGKSFALGTVLGIKHILG